MEIDNSFFYIYTFFYLANTREMNEKLKCMLIVGVCIHFSSNI